MRSPDWMRRSPKPDRPPAPASPPTVPVPTPRILALPRGVVILVGLAAGVVAVAGIRQVSNLVGPIVLALCLTITVYPARSWLIRHKVPKWLATLLIILFIYALLIVVVLALVLGVARFATLLPQYTTQINSTLDSIENWVHSLGVGPDQIQSLFAKIGPGLVSFVGSIVSSTLSVASTLIFVITLVLFMGVDSGSFTTRMTLFRPGRARALDALGSFAYGTRKYFAVSTIFGGIVAILDTAAVLIMGIPAALLWGMLAFLTNYVPNVGFIIGLIPVAILALLVGGVGKMIAIIVVYCVLNFVVQSVIQPKFVGDAVGLTTTISFLSLVVWAFILGPLGAVLAVPLTLLVKAVLVDSDNEARWLQLFLGDAPKHVSKSPT